MASTNDADKKKEVERFKRRMIRVVARQLLEEKKPEPEIWKDLKEETGYDCELVWVRMRSITIKKLRRMLAAEDRIAEIPKPALMTITDWLLFDLVLVHEKIDVIGMDGVRLKPGELKPLTDLFSLVQKYEIEEACASPLRLAEAWTQATLFYNSQGHHVSPMLLQKRWYQLKESTRDCFYKFWFSYRGNAKQFSQATSQHMPTMLQMAIARRFKEVVTCTFLEWDEMIQLGLVVLPDEFEKRMRPKPKPIDENVPDLVVVEPVIETIDLDADTSTETNEGKQSSPQTTPAPQTIVKTEPQDESDTEVVIDADLLDDTLFDPAFDDIDTEDIDVADAKLDENVARDHEKHPSESNNDRTIPSNSENGMSVNMDEIVTSIGGNNSSGHGGTLNTGLNNLTSKMSESEEVIDRTENIELMKENIENDHFMEPLAVLPQITSVVGNADLTISDKLNTNTQQDAGFSVIDSTDETSKEIVSPNILVSVKQEDIATDDCTRSIEQIIDKTCENALKKLLVGIEGKKQDAVKSEEVISPFGQLPSELNLSDEGVELVDDGIEYVDDDLGTDNNTETVKIEIPTSEDEDANNAAEQNCKEDTPKIDLKLLLYPVVYTMKLDNMGIKAPSFESVQGKPLIDDIYLKSKPISKRTVDLGNVKKELEPSNELSRVSDDDETGEHAVIDDSMAGDADKETEQSDEEDIISNDCRVKLSSYLLQKPRTRTYNPIVLCKNPDFNTRLKRLNVGFFGSQRNMMLLKHCKPLTIDVSKAFESKLINGRIYIKNSEQNVNNDEEVVHKSDSQQVSVIPSAMPVQSLINIQTVNPIYTTPKIGQSETDEDLLIAERSKIINLPDISQVRRLNQRLLTAEVTPIQIQNTGSAVSTLNHAKPSLTTSSTTSRNDIHNADKNDEGICNSIAVRKNAPSTSVGNFQDLTLHDDARQTSNPTTDNNQITPINKPLVPWISKKKYSFPAWKSRELRPKVTWVKTNYKPASDVALLTIDTLNKMLYLLSQEKEEQEEMVNKSSKVLTKTSMRELRKKRKPVKPPSEKPAGDDSNSDDVQIVSNSNRQQQAKNMPPAKPKINIVRTRPSKKYKKYCCWASHVVRAKTTKRKRIVLEHKCPENACQCCCKKLLESNEFDRSLRQACESIESVVQQTYKDSKQATHVTNTKTQSVTIDAATDCEGLNTESVVTIDLEDPPPIGAEVSVTSTNIPSVVPELISNADTSGTSHKKPVAPIIIPARSLQNRTIPLSVCKVVRPSPKPYDQNVNYQPMIKEKSQMPLTSNPKSCNCTPHLSVAVNRLQKRIVIDGSSCQLHSMHSRKIQGERQIYITSKQITQKPPKCPIFLGKNKVLLTNIKFPAGFKSETIVPQRPVVKIVPTIPLPVGVQLVLLDNGDLTYTVDPNVQLDDQQKKSLPDILNAVKQKLHTEQIRLTDNVADNTQNNEVFTLSDDDTNNPEDETPAATKNTRTDANVITATPNKVILSGDSVTNKAEVHNDKIKGSSVEVLQAVDAPTVVHADANKEQGTTFVTNEERYCKAKNKMGSIGTNDAPVTSNITNETEVANETGSGLSNSPKITVSEGIVKEGKGKNILSDLMEMSGISAEDAAPAACNPEPMPLNPPPLSSQPSAANLSEFSTITSFTELKYACARNGLFFKLDFETGIIVPINVCIKKQPQPALNKQAPDTIDLTEDDVPESNTSNLRATPTFTNASRRSISILKAGGSGSVKPIKLFKSVYNPNKPAPEKRRGRGRPRKQTLEMTKIVVDYDSPMEEEYLDTSDPENRALKRPSDGSSDEEPLSNVAKKMRENEDARNSGSEDTENVRQSLSPLPAEEPVSEAENFGIMLGQSDEDNDDDCILGV